MKDNIPSDFEVCRYCEGGAAMSPADCPECEGEVMVRYVKLCACGEKLVGHEDESATQCRWCVTGWKPSDEPKGSAETLK